jgi:hypothetical protein
MKLDRRIRFIERRLFWTVALWLDGRLYSGPAWKHTGTKCSASEAWGRAWEIAFWSHRMDRLRRPTWRR